MICRLFALQATERIREAFEEKTKLILILAAIYTSRLIIH